VLGSIFEALGMVNLLIPYVRLPDHQDPMLEEFTYGDVRTRARKLKRDLQRGNYAFFHTTTRGRRFITAYYVVDRVLDTSEAAKNELIRSKYRNPHISEFMAGERAGDDVLIFGDPILSRKLPRPLPFDRVLAEKLSLEIPFTKSRPDPDCITSATRQWRKLTDDDVRVLLDEIKRGERLPTVSETLLSTDEVEELREIDLEDLLTRNPDLLEKGLALKARQYEVTPTDRIDLLFMDTEGKYVVVELKQGSIGRGALSQIRGYMRELKKTTKKDVRGVIVCKDVLSAFRETYRKLHDVKVYYYGWRVGFESADARERS
jgi:hypothetical protein